MLKLLTAVITWIVFTLVVSLIFMNPDYSFGFYVVSFGIYSILPILLLGVPSSYAIDFIAAKGMRAGEKWIQTIKLMLYGVFGFLATLLFILFLKKDTNVFESPDVSLFLVLGICAAILFYAVERVLKLFFQRNVQRE